MKIHAFPAGPIPTNAYLLTEPALGQAVLIDAPEGVWAEVEPVLEREKSRLTDLWITHGHWDHVQGGGRGRRGRPEPRGRPTRPTSGSSSPPQVMSAYLAPGTRLEPVKVDTWLTPPQKFQALGAGVEVRHVPGHCPGNVLFQL